MSPDIMNNPAVDPQIAEALAASERGEHDRAMTILRSAMNRSGEDPLPWLLLGAELASTGQMTEAESAYANAVLRFPRVPIARFQLGLLQLSSGRLAQAALTWDALLNGSDDDPLRHYVEGFLALAVDDFDAARHRFDLGLQLPQTNEALVADIRKTLAQMADKGMGSGRTAADSPEESAHHHVLLRGYGGARQTD